MATGGDNIIGGGRGYVPPPLIARLPPASVVFAPTTPDFTGTAQQEIGALGSGSDGFDAIFATPAANIDGDAASLSDLDTMIAAADFGEGAFKSVYHDPVDGELPGLLSDGDALNADVQNPGELSGSPTITPPPSPPAPPDTGGGGDPGGGGGGGDIGGGGPMPDPGTCEIDPSLPGCGDDGSLDA